MNALAGLAQSLGLGNLLGLGGEKKPDQAATEAKQTPPNSEETREAASALLKAPEAAEKKAIPDSLVALVNSFPQSKRAIQMMDVEKTIADLQARAGNEISQASTFVRNLNVADVQSGKFSLEEIISELNNMIMKENAGSKMSDSPVSEKDIMQMLLGGLTKPEAPEKKAESAKNPEQELAQLGESLAGLEEMLKDLEGGAKAGTDNKPEAKPTVAAKEPIKNDDISKLLSQLSA